MISMIISVRKIRFNQNEKRTEDRMWSEYTAPCLFFVRKYYKNKEKIRIKENEKGQVLEGTIEKVEFPNKGVVTVAEEGKSVIVKNGIPGQKVKFCVNKFKRGNAEGRLLEVLEKSPLETRKPVCSIFPVCGGCMYQTMSYEAQMDMKAEQVKNILNEAVNGEYLFEGVKASPKEFAYRNKMEFSFGDEYKDGPLTLGLHKKAARMMC